ncbi:MAG: GH36-type glycosyl hydrolase domain-containing protein [Oligosphaeraceae bacterium]
MNTEKHQGNPYGHFDPEKHEYVITSPLTPRAWINYLGGVSDLGAFVSNRAGGTVWYKQPHTGRLTRYQYMAQPEDNPGFFLYVKEKDKAPWSPSFMPTRTPLDRYECRHGLYYTTFDSEKDGIGVTVRYMIPRKDPVMLWDITFTNHRREEAVFSAYPYQDFAMRDVPKEVLYFHFCGNQMTGFCDQGLGALRLDYFAYEAIHKGYTLFNASKPFVSYEMSRDRFMGRCRGEASPEALETGELHNSEVPGAGFCICGCFRLDFRLAPGASERVIVKLTASPQLEEAASMLRKYDDPAAVDEAAEDFAAWWRERLNRCQVKTPDAELNEMLNVWLPKNIKTTMRCGRSISQRHTGCDTSKTFRDTMQDIMSGALFFPEETRENILLLMRSIRKSGQATHFIDPSTFKCSVPDYIRCDSIVWGVFTVAKYVHETGDWDFLKHPVLDYEGEPSTVQGLLLRGMHFTGDQTGAHGLPKLFNCDWNDQLVVVSAILDSGESIMVAEQYIVAARVLLGLLDASEEAERSYLEGKIREFTQALESPLVWDGDYYRRLLFPNDYMGGEAKEEGRIFLNTQSWAAMAGTLNPEHVAQAMDSVYRRLNTQYGLRLYEPPFTKLLDGNRYCGNVPGAGENAGLFYHANNWAIIAEAMRGNADRAWEYFNHIMPQRRSADSADLYEREPYAFASWCYGPDNASFGKAALSHLTGGASWIYRTATEFLLGIRPEKGGLRIVPCIPQEWDGYSVERTLAGVRYVIEVRNPDHKSSQNLKLAVDGVEIDGNFVKHPAPGSTVHITALCV